MNNKRSSFHFYKMSGAVWGAKKEQICYQKMPLLLLSFGGITSILRSVCQEPRRKRCISYSVTASQVPWTLFFSETKSTLAAVSPCMVLAL